MNSVRLYFTKLQDDADLWPDENRMEQWLSEIPGKKRQSIKRYVHKKNRVSSLLALRLLKKCAEDENIGHFRLADIQYPDSGKPYWSGKNRLFFDFNISHSADLVMVAVSKTVRLGVDAEVIRPMKNMNFKMVMSAEELTEIQQSPALFFDIWSKKEAVVKAANTAGISRMRDVQLAEGTARLDTEDWFLTNLSPVMETVEKYAVQLAASAPVEQITAEYICANNIK